MTLLEGSMLMMAPKLETYRYTSMDSISDDSIDSDDERYNYVIDLDYKEDSDESTEKQTESPKQEVTKESDKQAESHEDQHNKKTREQSDGIDNNTDIPPFMYTLKEEPILNQDKELNERKTDILEDLGGKDLQNYNYTLDCSKSYINNETVKHIKIKEVSTKENELKSNDSKEINGAIYNSDSSTMCNTALSNLDTATTAKLVGASKRKRKLENTITNLIKAKSVCVRETSVPDSSLPRQSNSSQLIDISSSSSSSPVISENSRSHSINQHSIDLSQKSGPKPSIPSSLSECYTSVISSLNLSPSSNQSLNSPVIPNTTSNTQLHQPSIPTSSQGSINLTQKSSNRRKSSFVYRYDNVNGDSNFNQDILNLSVNKVKQEPTKHDISDQNEVMDLSKSSKLSQNHPTNCDMEGVMDLSKPSKNVGVGVTDNTPIRDTVQVKDEPVDLSSSNSPPMDMNSDIKQESGTPNGHSTDQLKVMDIFKDMMTTEKGGTVTMQQFMGWMQKMQPGSIENLNVMQLNAYYMQFNYWMQAFYNNSLMNGLANQKGDETHLLGQHKKNGRQRKGQRRSSPVMVGSNNSPSQVLSNNPVGQPLTKSLDSNEDDVLSKLNDYNANRVKQSDIEFPACPEMNILKERYGCYIAKRDGKTKFFVKDNEEIKTIVNMVMAVADIKEDETQNLERDENGLCARFVCRICEQKFFHSEHLSKHVKTLHIQKRFQCDQCERSFHDAGNYRQHIRVHDASDIPYECPECNRRFRHKCTLKVHMRIHTGEKPFKCDVCQATFKISSGLQTHMRKHTGETPYACEFCSLRFKCQSNLKQHLFQHTQARPFPCDICGKSYSRKSIRDSHMLTHYKVSDLNVTV